MANSTLSIAKQPDFIGIYADVRFTIGIDNLRNTAGERTKGGLYFSWTKLMKSEVKIYAKITIDVVGLG